VSDLPPGLELPVPPAVTVDLPTHRAQWGRRVTGLVVVTAGAQYVRLDHVRARLVERWGDQVSREATITTGEGRVHAQADWPKNTWLRPHQRREWAFQLRVPWDSDFDHFWAVQGAVRMVNGTRAAGLAPLEMGPHPSFEIIAEATARALGLEVGNWSCETPWVDKVTSLRGAWACVELPARDEWQPFIQSVIIRLRRTGSKLAGELQVTLPKERSRRRLHSAAVLASRPARFSVPKHDLHAAVLAIQQALQPMLLERFRAINGANDLPLPAAAAIDIDSLPGASQAMLDDE